MRVAARELGLIEGEVRNRLEEGASVRVDFELTVLSRAGGTVVGQTAHTVVLSFDLWEERFAAAKLGMSSGAVSHRDARRVEAWCVDTLTLPITSLGEWGRGAPFWVRLSFRVQEPQSESAGPQSEGFTLGGLVDRLSRRRDGRPSTRTLEAGPFRLGK